jgi:hypothetical protein
MSKAGVTCYLLHVILASGTILVKLFTYFLLYSYRIIVYIAIVVFTSPDAHSSPT